MKTGNPTLPGSERRGADRGAVSLETVGLIVLAAMLVGALVVTLTQHTPVGARVAQAVCQIVTAGQGDCAVLADPGATRAEPTEACTVNDSTYSGNVSVTAVAFKVGKGYKLRIEKLSDKTFRVSDMETDEAGIDVGAGAGVSFTIADKTVGEVAQANATAVMQLSNGSSWSANSQDEVNDIVKRYAASKVATSVTGPSILSPGRWIAERAVDSVYGLPEADETFVQGAAVGTLEATVVGTGIQPDGAVALSGEVGVSGSIALGQRTSKNGDITYYVQSEISGKAGLQGNMVSPQAMASIGAQAEGSATVVTAVTYDAGGNMKKVGTTTVGMGSAGIYGQALVTGAPPLDGEISAQRATVNNTSLDTTNPDNRKVAAAFLRLQGFIDPPGTVPVLKDASIMDGNKYFDQARASGTVTSLGYDFDSTTPLAASGKIGLGAKADGALSTNYQQLKLTDAQYYNGKKMDKWTGCLAGM